jgi:hypothetical protein
MAGDIHIKVDVDAGQAVTGLNSVTKGLADTAAVAAKTDSSLGKLSKVSNTAGQSLTNLGRIAQDAPFGFIGIQNNINPLLESFGRLKAETGSTGSALKALAGSLIGAGGIGLAVSLVTSALTVLTMNGFFKSAKAADAAAESAKKYKEELNGIFTGVAKEAEGVLSLIAILKSETETRDRKLSAIKELQKINPEIFKDLELEKSAVIGVDNAYKNYIATLQNAVTVKVLQKRLDNELARLVEQEGLAKTKSEKGNRALTQFYLDTEKNTRKAASGVGVLRLNFAASLDPITATKGRIEELVLAISEFSSAIKVTDSKGATDKVVKDVKTIEDVLAELAKEIDFLNTKEIQLGSNESKAKISAIESTIQKLVKDFKVNPKGTIISKLFGDIKDINISNFREELKKNVNSIKIPTSLEIKEDLISLQKKIDATLGVDPRIKPIKIPLEVTREGSLFTNEERAAIEETAAFYTDVFSNLGKSIGQSLGEGGNVIRAAFQGILQVMGDFLVKMGEAAIKNAVLAIAIKNTFKNPVTGLIAGAAAVIAGTLLKTVQIPAFADGVQNFGGGVALVGERGPELVRLPQGSDVIPNYQLNNMQGGSGMQVIIPSITLRGQDMVVAFNRANQTISRNG